MELMEISGQCCIPEFAMKFKERKEERKNAQADHMERIGARGHVDFALITSYTQDLIRISEFL